MAWQARRSQARSVEQVSGVASAEHQHLISIVAAASGDQKQMRKADAPQEETETHPASNMRERGESLKEDLDRIIDEIDEVLEENAEEFVKNYVQRGGE